MSDVEDRVPESWNVFAAAALQGMLAGAEHGVGYYERSGAQTRQKIAETAAKFADSMLEERVKREADR